MCTDEKATRKRRRTAETLCASTGCSNTVAQRPDIPNGYRKYCSTCGNLRSKYGIDLPSRTATLEGQGSRCSVCRSEIAFSKGKSMGKNEAVVDHCHVSGKVRGIICGRCNIILGKAEDDMELLKELAKYLEENG